MGGRREALRFGALTLGVGGALLGERKMRKMLTELSGGRVSPSEGAAGRTKGCS